MSISIIRKLYGHYIALMLILNDVNVVDGVNVYLGKHMKKDADMKDGSVKISTPCLYVSIICEDNLQRTRKDDFLKNTNQMCPVIQNR